MNALSTRDGGDAANDLYRGSPGEPPVDAALGLQLSRASALSLLRLQLALERGDRIAAIEAIDRLHAVDSQVEKLVESLPCAEDPKLKAITRQILEEKMALAFEKLALASGVSGPDLASAPAFLRRGPSEPPATVAEPDIEEYPVEVTPPFGVLRTYAPRAALLVALAAGTAGVLAVAL
ncbi:hypothetical protein [Sphingopyxis flava]|uniref:Uncharacterized protein n=1 Tax=Sphingopyxis flava TaxID=1507287 RepID=A0A1T5APX2_9SPHN|nr:hypothetical protein [Sphingopyxis flava]SKB36850.1 hypothetical protein SAMN06295937_100477 [Sphingopyxis flava]